MTNIADDLKTLSSGRVDWPELGYSATFEAKEYFMSFKVYAIYGVASPGNQILWAAWDEAIASSTGDIEKADVFCSGDVKWDGCTNFQFDEQERCALHCCDRKSLADIGELLRRVHVLAEEKIPKAAHDLMKE